MAPRAFAGYGTEATVRAGRVTTEHPFLYDFCNHYNDVIDLTTWMLWYNGFVLSSYPRSW